MALLNKDNALKGDGCTVLFYKDRQAYTIIDFSKNKRYCYIRRNIAIPDRSPEFCQGGFSANCTNNNEIKYSYKEDKSLPLEKATADMFGEYILNGCSIITGRDEFYDHNF